jgi:hypothetical protein
MKKSGKPLITVTKDKAVRRAYSLNEDAAETVDEYASFLSEFTGRSVKPGDIIERLVEKLDKDPLFAEWRAKKKTPAPATSVTSARTGKDETAPGKAKVAAGATATSAV